jgi:uncharacterized repeat protein (TIGR01451 family)
VITAQSLPKGSNMLAKCAYAICALLILMLWPTSAQAQTFSNTTTSAIVDSTTCAAVTTRTFTVSNAGTLADVDLGVILSHTSRSNLRISLAHNNGSNTVTVNLMTNVTDASDNMNVRFDDAAANPITSHTGANDDVAVAAFQRTFSPQSVLSALNGRTLAGTWTLTLCDSVAVNTGTFRRVDLILTAQTPADFAVSKSDGVAMVASQASTNYTIIVTNNGPASVTGAILTDPAILGLTISYVACAPTPGQCTAGATPTIAQLQAGYALPALASGQSYRLTVIATVTATSGNVVNTATVTLPSNFVDSAPANNTNSDTNSVFTRVPGTPPNITCPVGSVQRSFNWSASNWVNGTGSQTVAIPNVGNTPISFSLSGGAWVNDANTGQPSPNSTNFSSYGLATNPWVIRTAVDFANNGQVMTASYSLPTAVPAAEFQLFDVDYQANSWADRVEVNASYNGSAVPVTLTAGTANYVIGNVVFGDAASSSAQSFGNVFVTIAQPVDTIVVTYGNHSNLGSIANPVTQFIAWGGFSKICDPVAALNVTKISSVLDDYVSGNNHKSLPGALVRYCITVTNTGSGTATGVTVNDPIPTNVTYVAGSLMSGSSCGAASTIEDDDNSGTDESDPVGMSVSGTTPVTISGSLATLPPNQSVSLVFHATIN